MELRAYLTALRKGWWLVVLAVLIGGAAGALMVERATPMYAAHVSFYVSTPAATTSTAYSTDQFAQAKANSYATILSSTRLGQLVVKATGLPMSAGAVAAEISGNAPLNTVIVDATIIDPSPQRALTIAKALAVEMPNLVNELDNTGVGAQNVSLAVVNEPSVGSAPVSPRKKVDIGLGIVAGLVVGVIAAVLRHVLDTSLRNDEAVQEVVGAPVLATINFDPAVKSEPLLIGDTAHSPRGEAFRRLRTNLQFVSAAQRLHTLVVTSSTAGEGKSLTSSNLALVMSDAGQRVLLIEADLRRPKLADYFGLERAVGLTNVLAGDVAVDDVIQSWGETNVSVLASGPLPPNPSELLGGKAMKQLLMEMRNRFDLVIIDTPPLLPVTDAAVLATEADGVLIIFRYRKTTRNQVASAVRSLRAVNVRIAGTVVNMKPISRSEKRTYGDYRQYTTPTTREGSDLRDVAVAVTGSPNREPLVYRSDRGDSSVSENAAIEASGEVARRR